MLFLFVQLAQAQTGRYWDQNLNSEAALLSGAVVAGESGIAAIYYNPATISEMTRNNLSLSANLVSVYFYEAENALGSDFPANRTQMDIYPRIITLTINPRKKPDLTIEMAYFNKSNEFMQINQGTSLTGDIIPSNPGEEQYTSEYYLRSRFQDYYGGAGFGYTVSDKLALGLSVMVSYKDDQLYNQISANAFTLPQNEDQYLSAARYNIKFNMFDIRLIAKLGIHYKNNALALGANINLPSMKIFGDGTVFKEYAYSNIHKETGNDIASSYYQSGRQRHCVAHFKDPLSAAAGVNFYSPSRNSILLFSAEYFFKLSGWNYIEANPDPGDNGYNTGPADAAEWLNYRIEQQPVFNAGIAYKQQINDDLMFSGGFRTDFNYNSPVGEWHGTDKNRRSIYNLHVYHINYGLGYRFARGNITLGMQFSHGRADDQPQVVNLTEPVEFIDDSQMPLTGPVQNNVQIRYNDISIYLGFMFNFLKE